MGLENLKSVFSNIVTNKTQSDITSFSTELDDIRPISINGISTLDSSFDNLESIPIIIKKEIKIDAYTKAQIQKNWTRLMISLLFHQLHL